MSLSVLSLIVTVVPRKAPHCARAGTGHHTSPANRRENEKAARRKPCGFL
jgi:hypothetical protein